MFSVLEFLDLTELWVRFARTRPVVGLKLFIEFA